MTAPVATILIPAYNPGEYLREAVESALAQTREDIEVIVIDDGSTDGSVETITSIKDSRLEIMRQDNAGKAVALNRALEVARGRHYCILDGDDRMSPYRVEQQGGYLDEHPEIGAVFCGHALLIDGKRLAPRARAKCPETCARDIDGYRMPAHDPTAMLRLSMVGDLRYDPDLRIGQGYDYLLRVGERHPMAVLGECLYDYRAHVHSVTRQSPTKRVEYVRRVHDKAAARRGLSPDQIQRYEPNGARLADNNIAAHFMESVIDARTEGRFGQAMRTGLACVTLSPLNPYYYRALAFAVMPSAIRRSLRRSERVAP